MHNVGLLEAQELNFLKSSVFNISLLFHVRINWTRLDFMDGEKNDRELRSRKKQYELP